MIVRLILQNLLAYSLQIGMLVGVAAFVPALLRLRQPGAKLIYWQILLAACLLLPLQPWRQVVEDATGEVTTTVTAVQPVTHAATARVVPRSEIALLVLLAGMAIRLGCLAIGIWKLRRYRRHSYPLEPAPSWNVEAALLISDDVISPVTFGWRKPVVLLPANFPLLDATVQDAILCHEILHVRRRDWLFTVVEELVRSVFWFHPAIWWLLGEIGLAREQEVDRQAIGITNRREEYMDALLTVAGVRVESDLAPAPLFLRKRHLKHRVLLIVKEARMSKARLVSTLAASLAALALACWLTVGAFPLTAQPQIVSDAAGVTVNLNGAALLHRTAVHYPTDALAKGIQGVVAVELKLDGSGEVVDANVIGGPDELRRAALESVLDWHFSRDSANSTRVVQISFELPKAAEAPEGATATISQPNAIVAYRNGIPMTAESMSKEGSAGAPPPPPPAPTPTRLTSIVVNGLSEDAKSQLLASLPVHEGDMLSADGIQLETNAIHAFDEHLSTFLGSSASGLTLTISAPGVPTTNLPRIKVGANVQSAMIVSKVAPAYPPLAKQARVQGVVQLQAVIAPDGTISELHSLSGPALLIQSAIDAVKQWVYRPTLLNGQPVAVETNIDVNFTLAQ